MQFLRENAGKIGRIVQSVCRRHKVFGDDAVDYSSEIMLKLMEDDCRALRVFKEESTIDTYLTTVINNRFRDLLRESTGRWRPSKRAKELGPAAVKLEELLYQHHYPFHEALEIMRTDQAMTLSEAEAKGILQELREREARPVTVEYDMQIADTRETPEQQYLRMERLAVETSLTEIVDDLRKRLPPEERLMLRMIYEDNLKVSVVARQLNMTRYEVERRLETIISSFRKELLQRGVNYGDVKEIMGGDND